jgi:hypothetical protein
MDVTNQFASPTVDGCNSTCKRLKDTVRAWRKIGTERNIQDIYLNADHIEKPSEHKRKEQPFILRSKDVVPAVRYELLLTIWASGDGLNSFNKISMRLGVLQWSQEQ